MFHDQPPLAVEADPDGMFGAFGGAYMPETLMPAVAELAACYAEARRAPDFWQEYRQLLQDYVGRPSPLFLARRLSAESGGAGIFLKREDLNHTGAHKINNCIGQILLARRMGKRRVIAETGAGQHGVATASVCALFGMSCVIYMGRHDMERQLPNVKRMELLGARVRPVDTGSATLKDAMNEALRDWITHVEDTYYLLGTGAGPHPYPQMVCDFQQVIGREAREQFLRLTGKLPDALVACVGGGSNAAGLFIPFLADNSVELYGVEAAGRGLDSGEHAASLQRGRPGVLHGNRTYLLQDEDGQIVATHSVSAGLDYPGIGPLHSQWFESGRVSYGSATDDEAVAAYHWLSRCEGILPALESAHALAFTRRLAATLPPEAAVIVNLSGRGDKDVETVLNFAAGGGDAMKPLASRIESTLTRLHGKGRTGLIAYLCAGDPDFDTSLALLDAAGEADMVEIGLPFSDPVADGPVLQEAHMRALAGGQTVVKTLQLLRAWRLRRPDTPAILMGYLNPVLTYGAERFMRDAADAGADALILVDLPHEHAYALRQEARATGLSLIQMVALTSDEARRTKILAQAEGFVYQVMLNGTTGARQVQPEFQMRALSELRACTALPIAAGFGIQTPQQAQALAPAADFVIVGSALVQAIQSGPTKEAVERCRKTIRVFLEAMGTDIGCDGVLADRPVDLA